MPKWFATMTDDETERCQGVLFTLAAITLMAVASPAHAQFDVPFLDMVPQIFDGLRHHRAIPSICACFFVVGGVLFAKTHQISWLFVTIGASVAIGIWVKQDSLLAQIGYQ